MQPLLESLLPDDAPKDFCSYWLAIRVLPQMTCDQLRVLVRNQILHNLHLDDELKHKEHPLISAGCRLAMANTSTFLSESVLAFPGHSNSQLEMGKKTLVYELTAFDPVEASVL